MRREVETGLSGDVPIVLSQWYDTAKWILEKIDSFPKNQRFIFGTRLADRSLGILEGLIQVAYTGGPEKLALLEVANRDLAVLRWLVRMAMDRKILTPRQYEFRTLHSAFCLFPNPLLASGFRLLASGLALPPIIFQRRPEAARLVQRLENSNFAGPYFRRRLEYA